MILYRFISTIPFAAAAALWGAFVGYTSGALPPWIGAAIGAGMFLAMAGRTILKERNQWNELARRYDSIR